VNGNYGHAKQGVSLQDKEQTCNPLNDLGLAFDCSIVCLFLIVIDESLC